MFSKFTTRRQFLKYGKLSFLLLLNACSNNSRKVTIGLQNSFYPDFFKRKIPDYWLKENINFSKLQSQKKQRINLDYDFTLINDGWLSRIDFNEFKEINQEKLFEKLDLRSRDFLNSFEENKKNKLFPVGVVPYGMVIKNNKDLIYSKGKTWDLLLSKKLTGKIIFPQSPRIFISIAKKINDFNSLAKLKAQAMLFDDQNSLNWLINSDACVAIMPFSFCLKYLKLDSRLSIVFPEEGVPLMWHFVLSKSIKNGYLTKWIESLEIKSNSRKLASQGWYLPYINSFSEKEYKTDEFRTSGPSKICWDNSWSFPLLRDSQKINLEKSWDTF